MKDFIKLCIRTEAPISPSVLERMEKAARALHAIIGVCTEAGELQDAFKKHIFYGKPLDKVNVKEEVADLLWYIGLICDWLECTIEELEEMVIAKLSTRYPDKFQEELAENRNLEAERKILESGISEEVARSCDIGDPSNYADDPNPQKPKETDAFEKLAEEQQKQMESWNGDGEIDSIGNDTLFLRLKLDLNTDEDYHLAVGIKKLLFHHTKHRGLSNLLDQKLIAFVETLPPLKNPNKEIAID